jgi:Domain of unknown function (DUF4954)
VWNVLAVPQHTQQGQVCTPSRTAARDGFHIFNRRKVTLAAPLCAAMIFLRELQHLPQESFSSISTAGRNLEPAEIETLSRSGNWTVDWSHVRFAGSDAVASLSRIKGCTFIGPVLLHDFNSDVQMLPDAGTTPFPAGLYNSTLGWCFVAQNALLKDCSSVLHTVIGAEAALVGCCSVSCAESTAYANGIAVTVGPETGGRSINCTASTSMQEAVHAAFNSSGSSSSFEQQAATTRTAHQGSCTVVQARAQVVGCKRIMSAYIGEHALIQNSELDTVTILSSSAERSCVTSSAIISSSLLQHGCTVSKGAIVTGSLLLEHSSVESHAQVTSTVLGPDSHIASGECHHCLLGPFIGFHHQSLLIAALWPLGRGNVSYGSNVGSNHTGRLADQELWAGEGIFFGLSCVIKYPANLTAAPYSLIASGTVCLPQRVAFPFSLICAADAVRAGVSPAFNQLQPGWVLQNSMYTVARSAAKYASRATAVRTRVSWPVFRPSTVTLMVSARAALRRALEQHSSSSAAVLIGDAAVSGLGKNFMTLSACANGVKVYTLHIQRYCLLALLQLAEQHTAAVAADSTSSNSSSSNGGAGAAVLSDIKAAVEAAIAVVANSSSSGSSRSGSEQQPVDELNSILDVDYLPDAVDTAYPLSLLPAKYPHMFTCATDAQFSEVLVAALHDLVQIENSVAAAVECSRARDDVRGAAVIPDYAAVHESAHCDAVVVSAQQQAADVETRAHTVIQALLQCSEHTYAQLCCSDRPFEVLRYHEE